MAAFDVPFSSEVTLYNRVKQTLLEMEFYCLKIQANVIYQLLCITEQI